MRILKSLAVLCGVLSSMPAYAARQTSPPETRLALLPRWDAACIQRHYEAIRQELVDEVNSYGPRVREQAADMPLLNVLRLLGRHEQADRAEARWRDVDILCRQP